MLLIAILALVVSVIGAGFAGWSAYSAHKSRQLSGLAADASARSADAASRSADAAERTDARDEHRLHEERRPKLQFSAKGTKPGAAFLVVQNIGLVAIDEVTIQLLPTGENPISGFSVGDSSVFTFRHLGSSPMQVGIDKHDWQQTATANFTYEVDIAGERWGPDLAETVTFRTPQHFTSLT